MSSGQAQAVANVGPGLIPARVEAAEGNGAIFRAPFQATGGV
jgi:hypothetical protein